MSGAYPRLRGYFFKKFREFWTKKAIGSKSENGSRKNDKLVRRQESGFRQSSLKGLRERLVGRHRE